ncbi:hypothetical protein I7I50_10298 [Histoplasma capsulatum G186AR]|uniref:Uncharacterized protein n=1 Tax=Ajellomyces capsulatus TaxID=5037 RepID=A0A8H7Z3M4_AJECA|nr:hypothetical protein I7I52_01537 [Histoplasma capsulatum]QSS69116.1 hypothetical protein I7I50_10298 [Histoplasma capsulatum G186AR]
MVVVRTCLLGPKNISENVDKSKAFGLQVIHPKLTNKAQNPPKTTVHASIPPSGNELGSIMGFTGGRASASCFSGSSFAGCCVVKESKASWPRLSDPLLNLRSGGGEPRTSVRLDFDDEERPYGFCSPSILVFSLPTRLSACRFSTSFFSSVDDIPRSVRSMSSGRKQLYAPVPYVLHQRITK